MRTSSCWNVSSQASRATPRRMKAALRFVGKALLGGALVLIPIYIAVLLLLKAAGSLLAVVKPIAAALPESWPAEQLLALLLVLAACFLVGVVVRSRIGDAGSGMDREKCAPADPGLHDGAKPRPPRRGKKRGGRLEASASGDRGRACSRFHHRGGRRRARHGVQFRRCPPRSPAPCMSLRASACTPWMFRSLKR